MISYKDILQKQIRELERLIKDSTEEKDELQRKLIDLKQMEHNETVYENNQLLLG